MKAREAPAQHGAAAKHARRTAYAAYTALGCGYRGLAFGSDRSLADSHTGRDRLLGFALLNQGLYGTIGRGWYQVAGEKAEPAFVDFLAYTLAKLLGLLDVLDLAKSHRWLRFCQGYHIQRGSVFFS